MMERKTDSLKDAASGNRRRKAAGRAALCLLLSADLMLLTSCGQSRSGTENKSSGLIEDTLETYVNTEAGSEAGEVLETEAGVSDSSLLVEEGSSEAGTVGSSEQAGEEASGEKASEAASEEGTSEDKASEAASGDGTPEPAAGAADSEKASEGEVSGKDSDRITESTDAPQESESRSQEPMRTGAESEVNTQRMNIESVIGSADGMIVGAGDPEMTEKSSGTENEDSGSPFAAVLGSTIPSLEESGQKWAMAFEDLGSGKTYGYREDEVMQSASVIKLFIMGTVYEYMCYPQNDDEMITFGESYSGELRDTISAMITVSDNDAANRLVTSLGQGEFDAGARLVTDWCRKNGYESTTLGRRFLASDLSGGDNTTTAADERKFLSDVYEGKAVNGEASSKMLDILRQQTLTHKIPAGLPEGFSSANKTGELSSDYGLGTVENDAALVFPPEREGSGYVLVVFSNDIGQDSGAAQSLITQISSETAAWYLKEQEET